MIDQTIVASPGPQDRTIRLDDGRVVPVPSGWTLLPPGDAGLTRRVKSRGPTWVIQEKRGRKVFSRGVWAPQDRILEVEKELAAERDTVAYAKRRERDLARREEQQETYVEDFRQAVFDWLNFADRYEALAQKLATVIAAHATPVGSGTVARTKRIPIEQRAEAAVIAWMRHQTTAYDQMKIARVKGKRREVRRELAEISRGLLLQYRQGSVASAACPLQRALTERERIV